MFTKCGDIVVPEQPANWPLTVGRLAKVDSPDPAAPVVGEHGMPVEVGRLIASIKMEAGHVVTVCAAVFSLGENVVVATGLGIVFRPLGCASKIG